MENKELVFKFPVDCLPAVGEVFSGQYSLPSTVTIHGTPRVLDIGANCGAFSIWAAMSWPGCQITAYEPQPDVFKFLAENILDIAHANAINSAVGHPDLSTMRVGKHSRLCSSQYDIGEQGSETFDARVIHPSKLPEADIVKIDAEGAEAFIIETLPFTPLALMVEWHGADQRRRIEVALADRMVLVSAKTLSLTTGIYCYVRP